MADLPAKPSITTGDQLGRRVAGVELRHLAGQPGGGGD